MTLTITRMTRWIAVATLLFFVGQLSTPMARAQAPKQAPAAGGAPTTPPTAGGPAASPSGTGNAPWPRDFSEGDRTYVIYQPQIDKWDGTRLHARAAVSVESAASPIQHFGVAWFSARADVDKVNRLAALSDFKVEKIEFPSSTELAADYQKVLEQRMPRSAATLSLDRVQAALAITEAQAAGAKPQPVKNDPPRVIFSTTPALLVLVDGKPVLRSVDGSSLLRVINTFALILVDKSGKHYLRAVGQWFEAGTLDGPWSVAARPPATLESAMQTVAKSQRVNLLDDPGPTVKDAAARGVLPTVYVSTVPAELVQTQGRPDFEPIEDTDLLHVPNSSDNILFDTKEQRYYVLLSGRWFRSPSLTDGPWEYVAHDKLPKDFAKIPETHPRGAVLASVPGTPQAKEALIDNNIPQTAAVNRATTTYQATYDGTPKFQPVESTPLQYAVNSPVPVIQVDSKSYYSLKDGVWFVAAAPSGPWAVATTVPAVIYTIPVSSPLYYVTYVQVYGSTSQVVYVGYTPGYYGTVVAPTSVVVYGTGYVYPPVYVGPYYYPPPVTYGYGAGFAWGAVTGFAFGAIAAGAWGGAWGCCGCCYGNVDIENVNINRANAYNRWNQGQVQSNLQSRAQSAQARASEARTSAQQRVQGAQQQAQQRAQSAQARASEARTSAQQRAQGAQQQAQERAQSAQTRASEARQGAQERAQSAQTRATEARQGAQQRAQGAQERAAATRSNDVYAGRDGSTYRRGAEGWEQNSGQGWNRANFSGGGESAADLNQQQRARSTGASRESSFQRSGGGSYSGGARASGGGGGRAAGGGGARSGGGGRRR
jgi:hypothetical protein